MLRLGGMRPIPEKKTLGTSGIGIFTGQMLLLSPNEQHQSTAGNFRH